MLKTMIITLVVIIIAIFVLGSKMKKNHTNKVDRVSAVEQMMNN
jgi:septation ring formation regulator EzrA